MGSGTERKLSNLSNGRLESVEVNTRSSRGSSDDTPFNFAGDGFGAFWMIVGSESTSRL